MVEPRWRQIAEDLRQKIESGELGHDGKPLPTELDLQDEYGASRNTVRDAVKWLVTRGMVYTRSGQGTFVAQKIDPFVTTLSTDLLARSHVDSAAYASQVAIQRRRPEVSVPKVEIQNAAGLVATELQLPAGSSVVSRHQQRFIDDVPYSLQTTFYPMQLVELGASHLIRAADIANGAVAYIEAATGTREMGYRERITVRVPDASESDFFGLPDDGRVSVFEFIRTGYDAAGHPLRVTVTTYPADRNQFVMISGTVPEESAAESNETGNDESPASIQ
jgi:GntR family transcriptional regulator